MERPRLTIAWLMIAVVFVAIDCTIAMVPGFLAGGLLLGLTLQAALLLWIAGQGRWRRFWAGFGVIGLAMLVAYEVGRHAFFSTIVRWPLFLFGNLRGVAEALPEGVSYWIYKHVPLINPNGNLTWVETLVVFEVSYGLPMILLTTLGGLVVIFLRSRPSSRVGRVVEDRNPLVNRSCPTP